MGLSSKQVPSDNNNNNNNNNIDWNKALLESTKTLEFPNTTTIQTQQHQQQQQQFEPLNCPRCDSKNTKFCYYNNYNKSQPRHFCKACKRHWTKGGTLRNVPVGGVRKNKRSKTFKNVSKTTNTATAAAINTGPNIPSHLLSNNNTNNITLQPQNLRVSSPSLVGSLNIDVIEPFYQNFLDQSQTSITFNSKTLNDAIFQHHNYDQEIQIPYTNLGNFENNPCSISSTITSIQSPNLYNFTNDHENNNGNLGSWDDFDEFVSVEGDLTIPWEDDLEIKP